MVSERQSSQSLVVLVKDRMTRSSHKHGNFSAPVRQVGVNFRSLVRSPWKVSTGLTMKGLGAR